MKDVNLQKTALMPNAANTVNTNIIELPQQSVRPFNTNFRARLSNTVATGANSKNINYRVYGSNEANGANAVLQRSFVVAGNAANHAASNREFYLDPESNVKYLYGSALGEANGGDAGDGTYTLEIVD
jgi:hypothetical protein